MNRLEFLYGAGFDADRWDLDDVEVRARLLEQTFGPHLSAVQLLGREIIANQIFADDPPEVWLTAQRLLTAGHDRESVFGQLVLAMGPVMRAAIGRREKYNRERYARALAQLPLPTADEIERTMVAIVRSSLGIDVDELVASTLARLPGRESDDVCTELVEHVFDDMVDEWGPCAFVTGDGVAHVGDLTAGIVLTHRLTDGERTVGVLNAAFDLAGFTRVGALTLPSGEPIDIFSVDPHHLAWKGPAGWLDRFPADALLCVRVGPDGVASVEVCPRDPDLDAGLVERVRGSYDALVEEPWLPVGGEELLLRMLYDDRGLFAIPRPPLSELVEAAGLERRQDRVAHDPSVWHNDVRRGRLNRVFDTLDRDMTRTRTVLGVLDVADLLSGIDLRAASDVGGPVDGERLRNVLEDLADRQVLSTVTAELFDHAGPDDPAWAGTFVDALLGTAKHPSQQATAHLLGALRCERELDPLTAERHLEYACAADPGSAAVIDRLAWYASDRGDARRAAQLWRQLEPTPGIAQDLDGIAPFAGPQRGRPGRNDPCFCGSGRKYKLCHLGSDERAPLPERVGWLCAKAAAFLRRRGGQARDEVVDLAHARATDSGDEDAIAEAFEDPIVMDLALVEGGWFEQFLAERGALLPDDEVLLARSWQFVDRTVYEVVEVSEGEGVRVRDLRTGEQIDVRERTFSRQARAGTQLCGRAVPDGHGHQFVGGLFPVEPGRASTMLDLLDEGDPIAIAGWVAALHRPPTLQTREGEDLIWCDVALEVDDPDAAGAFLDATFERESSGGDRANAWVEMFAIDADESILRARLVLEGSRLSVTANSEVRADRVIAVVRSALPGCRVTSDTRTPMDMQAVMERVQVERERAVTAPGGEQIIDLASLEAAGVLDDIRERLERRWCDESIPALGGLTPRQAADDPTRRGELQRLIASFERFTDVGSAITMRPQRLRELLALP